MILSVCVRTYNQERFIAQALDCILMQKTSFPFEIIVSDDGSKDKTQEVLRDYHQRYPDRFRLLLGESNQGGPKNLRKVIEASQAKYITCLDGDDYYTDCYKLQKQVEFLEANDRYVACFHNVMNVYESTGARSLFLPLDFPSEVTAEDVISKRWFMPIHSVMMRRELVSFPTWYEEIVNDDYVVNLSVVMHGPYYYMPDVMAAYRHHDANVSIGYSDQLLIDGKLLRILEGFSTIYPKEYMPVFEKRMQFFREEMAFYEKEMKHPWRKWFRFKTYKRMLKKLLRKGLKV